MLFQLPADRGGSGPTIVVISIASRCYSNLRRLGAHDGPRAGRDLYSVTMLFQPASRAAHEPLARMVVISIASRCYSNGVGAGAKDDLLLVVISIASRCYSNIGHSGRYAE